MCVMNNTSNIMSNTHDHTELDCVIELDANTEYGTRFFFY